MAFPLTPSNGQTTIVNGVTYQYNSTYNTWTVVAQPLPAYTGNIGNINLGNPDVTVYGNILPGTTNLYNLGNATASWANVTAGNVLTNNLYYANGAPYSFSNYANVNVAAYLSSQNITTYSNANVASYLPTYSGNLSAGNITVTGNLTVSNIIYTNQEVISSIETIQGNLVAAATTPSTSTTTGALVVVGGAGISGALNVGGIVNSAGNIFAYVQNNAAASYVTSNVSGYQLAQTINTGLGSLAIGFGTNTQPGGFMTIATTGGKNFIVAGSGRDFYVQTSTGIQAIYVTDANANVTLNSTTTSISSSTGALTVKGGVGIVGNINIASNLAVAGYANIGVTSVTDVAGGTYSDVSLIMPGYGWGMYSNVATAGTYYLRRILAKDSGNNIVIGAGGTALNSNVNIISGAGASNSFNVLHTNTLSPLLSVNSLANTVVISNNQSSTSNVTGALQVAGGVGVTGNIYGNSRIGFVYANSVSSVYTTFNQATASYDIVFG